MSKIRIAFVLRMVDDFTGEPVRDGRFLFTSGGRVLHSIPKKKEGMYVFLESGEERFCLTVESAGYHKKEVVIRRGSLDPAYPVAEIRLYGRPERYRRGCCGLFTGRLAEQPGGFPAEVLAERVRPVGLTFLKGRQEDGRRLLAFKGFTREELTGRTYILSGMKNPLPFVLTEKRGINEYFADLPQARLKEVRTGASLIRVYRSVSDASGIYAVPVEKGEECRLLDMR
ncbi:MAG: hypothetical protein K1W28_09440 [Lachnospiraceae bacterium]